MQGYPSMMLISLVVTPSWSQIRNDTVSLYHVAIPLQLKSKTRCKEDLLLLTNDKSRQLVFY